MARIKQDVEPVTVRLAVARSFTVEPVLPLLDAAAMLYDVRLELMVGDFNTYAQVCSTRPADSMNSDPTCLLAVETGDIAPELWKGLRLTVGDECRANGRPCSRRLSDMDREPQIPQRGGSHPAQP